MLKALVLPIALAAAACSPPASEPTATPETNSMSMSGSAAPAAPAAEGVISSTGTVMAVDPAAGTISLDHAAIPAINWPAMQMQFRAEDPAMLQGIAVGDHVMFELKSASETSIITMVHKQ